jgi:hypothetical protein
MSAMSHPTATGPDHRALHQAWWSLLLFPLSFGLAMLVGEGIPSWFGYSEPSLDSTPWWVITLAFGTALVVFAAPLLVTARVSNKAVAAGEQGGRAPLIVAGVVVGAFVALNLMSGIAQLFVS